MNDIKNCSIDNAIDINGDPTGGCVSGLGLEIRWQHGPLGTALDRIAPNGTFVETVLSAVQQRIEFYQTANHGKFGCLENEQAIFHIGLALKALEARTRHRQAREVEGTHTA